MAAKKVRATLQRAISRLDHDIELGKFDVALSSDDDKALSCLAGP
jgi:hypothetical protein